jgi:hypothetical protein
VTIAIRELGPSDAAACDAIVHSLPYHFGLEIGRAEAARACAGSSEQVGFTLVRDLPGEWDGGDTAVLLAMPLSG